MFTKLKQHLREWHRHFFLLSLHFLLVGCYVIPSTETLTTVTGTPEQFDCEKFSETRWKEFRFGVDSPEDFVATAAKLWSIDKEEFLEERASRGGMLSIMWPDTVYEVAYTAHFRNKKLLKLDSHLSVPATLGQVLNCFGLPEYYAAFEDATPELSSLNVQLWYPNKGLLIEHVSFSSQVRPLENKLALRMERYSVAAPGNPDQMIPNHFLYGDIPAVFNWVKCTIKPWPSSVETIEVESYNVENPRCQSP